MLSTLSPFSICIFPYICSLCSLVSGDAHDLQHLLVIVEKFSDDMATSY